MSVITEAVILSQDEILGIDEETDLFKISPNDRQLHGTMNNIQRATEEVCQNDNPDFANVHRSEMSDITNNYQGKNSIGVSDEDSEFFPMIATQGKQFGSTRYIWGGYVYTRDGYSRSFRCSNRQLYECPGRAVIKKREVIETKSHSHPREPQILRIEQIKQDMIRRAENNKSIGLRTIYLEACKNEPSVRTYLGLDMMLSKMKKARSATLFSASQPYVRPKEFNFEWAKDWLQVLPGQDRVAFCTVCSKEIILPTRIRIYNHYLSKIHKRAMLGLYSPPNKRFRIKKGNSSTADGEGMAIAEPAEPDSNQEDTYAVEVLDQFQDEVESMKTKKTIKKPKNEDYSSFHKEVIELPTNSDPQVLGKNNLKILNGCQPQSKQEIKLSSKATSASSISLHVWDPNTGQPTSGLPISLYKEKHDVWSLVCQILADEHGKCSDLLLGKDLTTGTYKLNLDTRSYYAERNQRCFYPYIEIVFEVEKVNEPYHFPIQLSPFAYNISRLSIS